MFTLVIDVNNVLFYICFEFTESDLSRLFNRFIAYVAINAFAEVSRYFFAQLISKCAVKALNKWTTLTFPVSLLC